MPGVDEYLNLTASNFKVAESYLGDAEGSLRTLGERLENCLKRLKGIPDDKSLLWEQLETLVQDSQPVGIREMNLVRLQESGVL